MIIEYLEKKKTYFSNTYILNFANQNKNGFKLIYFTNLAYKSPNFHH